MEVQLKVKVASTLKDEAALKAKAEGKSMKQVIEELLTSYVDGQEVVQLTSSPQQVEYPEGMMKPEDFESHLDYVDYLERQGLIY